MEEIFLKDIANLGGFALLSGFVIWKLWNDYTKRLDKNDQRHEKVYETHLDNAKNQTTAINELNKNVQSSGLLLFKELKSITEDMRKLATQDSINKNHSAVITDLEKKHKIVMDAISQMEKRLTTILNEKYENGTN